MSEDFYNDFYNDEMAREYWSEEQTNRIWESSYYDYPFHVPPPGKKFREFMPYTKDGYVPSNINIAEELRNWCVDCKQQKDYFDNLTDEEKEYEIEMAHEYWYEEDYLWLNVNCGGMVEIPDNFIFFPEGK